MHNFLEGDFSSYFNKYCATLAIDAMVREERPLCPIIALLFPLIENFHSVSPKSVYRHFRSTFSSFWVFSAKGVE